MSRSAVLNFRSEPRVRPNSVRPNSITLAAIAEAERLLHDPNAKSFTSMEDLRADLLSDEDVEE